MVFLLTTHFPLVLILHCPVYFGFLHNPAVTSVISMVYFSSASCVYSVYTTELNKTNADPNVYSQLCLLAVFSHDETDVLFSLTFNQFLMYKRSQFSKELLFFLLPIFFNNSV